MSIGRQPLLHFLLLGGVLFLGERWLPEAGPAPEPIHIAAAEVERIREAWRRETGTMPDAEALEAGLRRHADEEILLREALRLGLDGRDAVARERLVMNMRFAFPDHGGDDDTLLAQARQLGMQRRDLVVRRRLIQVMEMRITGGVELTERELRTHIDSHPERYAHSAQLGFSHVFVRAEREDAPAVAAALLARLRADDDKARELGDPFLLGRDFPPQTQAQIARGFGAGFAGAVAQLPQGEWRGPLRSPYGLHLVRVERRLPALPAEFARVREQAAYALMPQREAEALRLEIDRLRERYPLEIAAAGTEAVTP